MTCIIIRKGYESSLSDGVMYATIGPFKYSNEAACTLETAGFRRESVWSNRWVRKAADGQSYFASLWALQDLQELLPPAR